MQQGDGKPPGEGVRTRGLGCGCSVGFAGLMLLALTVLLVGILINQKVRITSPLWLVVLLLMAGVVLAFLRFRSLR